MNQKELDLIFADHSLWFATSGKSGKQAILDDLDLSGLSFQDIQISSASMNRTKFFECDLSGAEFSDTTFLNADFSNADLSNARFHRCELYEANFSKAILNYIDFYDSLLDDATFPEIKVEKGKLYYLNEEKSNIIMIIDIAPNGDFDALEGESGEVFRDLPFWYCFGLIGKE
jgi:uncharacterized protein YjbI with pentapeptide repeats